ncbi:MAG: glutamine--fructose-6-phosphate transaminase (isomerizing), partial [Clostridia bacterium]|nr:glutamine--fructose-6-phosphate transaminase (isomerizing) [Clostridia bacterium]
MCGIVGYIGSQDANTVLMEGLKKLEYRGYDSAGITIFVDNVLRTIKCKGKLSVLQEQVERSNLPAAFCGIGHTRWATHGEPSDINSHPHGSQRVSLVHNGIIENYMQIKSDLQDKGVPFLSQTDTETVARLLDYYYDGDPIEAIRKTTARLRGSYALGMVFADYPERIYALRKDNPLIVGRGEGENLIASDIPAILKYTRNYNMLDEGEIAILEKDTVTYLDADNNKIFKTLHTVTWSVDAAEKGGYEHFMLKEIHEQPTVFTKTISPRIDEDDEVDFSSDGIPNSLFREAKKIYFVACGTAMHAGLVGKTLIERYARIPCEVELASEFRYRHPILRNGDLVVLISQSGETADTLEALRHAKRNGIPTLAIVNAIGSSIAQQADYLIYTLAGPEIAVASTKAYYVQLAVLYLMAAKIARLNDRMSHEQMQEFIATLRRIPDDVHKMLSNTTPYQYHATSYQNAHN